MTALVLLPAHTPGLPEDRHLTLVYAGDQADTSVVSALAITASNLAKIHQAFAAKVMGVGLFGDHRNEPVLLIEATSEIVLMRSVVKQYTKSEHTEFRPHVAISGLTPKMLNIKTRPRIIYFNEVALWAGVNHQESETRWWLGS